MGAASYIRVLRAAALAAATGHGLGSTGGAGVSSAWAESAGAVARRVLVEETGGNGLSTGVTVAYVIGSIVLIAVSGLMVSDWSGKWWLPLSLPRQAAAPAPLLTASCPGFLPPSPFLGRLAWCWACCLWIGEFSQSCMHATCASGCLFPAVGRWQRYCPAAQASLLCLANLASPTAAGWTWRWPSAREMRSSAGWWRKWSR